MVTRNIVVFNKDVPYAVIWTFSEIAHFSPYFHSESFQASKINSDLIPFSAICNLLIMTVYYARNPIVVKSNANIYPQSSIGRFTLFPRLLNRY